VYASALQQANEAAKIIYSHSSSREDRQAAEQREREARREIDLLLKRTEQETESEFYAYRYIAAEGFMPSESIVEDSPKLE
jgi:hypothetical protein